MTIFLAILAPTLGFAGIFIGAFLTEWMRRKSRREQFAQIIFEKRLDTYEALLSQISVSDKLIQDVLDGELSKEQRHDIVSVAVHQIAQFVDEHTLYLDEDLKVHCVALFIGTEDILDAPEDEQEDLKRNYNMMRNEAIRMIAEDSGVAEINRFFKAVNRPNIDSPVIEYYRDLKKRKAKKRG